MNSLKLVHIPYFGWKIRFAYFLLFFEDFKGLRGLLKGIGTYRVRVRYELKLVW